MVVPVSPALTVRVNDFVAVCCGAEESATDTVKLNGPVCVVVPESEPLDCRLKPVGRVPETTDQL